MAINIFYSYSHHDKRFRNELDRHLSVLKRQGIIAGWHDRKILPGSEWSHEINHHIESSELIILLISADFLASDYCYDFEVKRALELHEQGKARVIPVILRPVDWSNSPLAKLQALPRDAQAVTTWKSRDAAWADIARGIRLLIQEMSASPTVGPALSYDSRQGLESYQLYEVFVKSGVPNVTFVEPAEFVSLRLALAQPGRGVVIEGPTGIGKTTALKKAIEQLTSSKKPKDRTKNSQLIEILSARNRDDVDRLKNLTKWHNNAVAIEDFHRLEDNLRTQIIDYLKYLADTEPISKKLVIVGIPHCGQALVESSPDIATRIDVFGLGKVRNELVLEMIQKGERALNIEFDRRAEIVLAAGGSLNIAQFLCFKLCEEASVLETQSKSLTIRCDIESAVSKVMNELSRKFEETVRRFAAIGGRKDTTCLELLEELRQQEDGFLSLTQLHDIRPDIRTGIRKFPDESWMSKLYIEYPNSKSFLFLDTIVPSLVVDDPQFAFYLGRLSISQLAITSEKLPRKGRDHIFISYSHRDSVWLDKLQVHLKPLVRKGSLTTWSDTNIRPGEDWRYEIERALASARVAILLVTPNFLASDFIQDQELPALLSAAQSEGLKIFWIAVSASLYESSDIARYQAANDPSKPLDSLRPSALNSTLVNICKLMAEAGDQE